MSLHPLAASILALRPVTGCLCCKYLSTLHVCGHGNSKIIAGQAHSLALSKNSWAVAKPPATRAFH